MNQLIYSLLLLFNLCCCAQIHEVGISVGGANYIGDIGSTTYINPNTRALGLTYKFNKSTRHAWRVNFNHIKLAGNDESAKSSFKNARGLSFNNTINEVSAGLEFNFLEYDLHNDWVSFSPYVFTGISGFMYKDSHFLKKKQVITDERLYQLAIPIHLGIKTSIFKKFILSAEMGARYTFTDHLDGTNPPYPTAVRLPFANTNQNDWFVTSMITLTYTFGQNPCYCLPSY